MTATPAALATEFADLKRRLDTLERATRMPALFGAGQTVELIENFIPSASWAPVVGGPDFDTHVLPSGRLFVLAEVVVTVTGVGGAGMYTSWRLTGPGGEVVPPAGRSSLTDATRSRAVMMYLHEGLTPGPWNLRLEVEHNGTAPTLCTWDLRTVIAVPL